MLTFEAGTISRELQKMMTSCGVRLVFDGTREADVKGGSTLLSSSGRLERPAGIRVAGGVHARGHSRPHCFSGATEGLATDGGASLRRPHAQRR